MDIADSSSDEFVETSDVEELEDLNRPPRKSSPRKTYRSEWDLSSRPHKRIKLAHNEDPFQSTLASTSAIPIETAAETPYRSQSSATIEMNDNTSPTQFGHSPTPERDNSFLEVDMEGNPNFLDNSQDLLLLRTPLKESCFPRTPLKHWPNLELSAQLSLFQRSTTPPESPHNARMRNLAAVGPIASPLKWRAESPEQSQIVDSQGSPHLVELEEREEQEEEPGINNIFSSPVRPSERSITSSMPSESVPVSPGGSIVDPSPSPPESPLLNLRESSKPDQPTEEPEYAPQPKVVKQVEVPQHGYSMRNRLPNQLRPYLADKVAYTEAFKAYPEAFVKGSAKDRHHDPNDQYEQGDEETQELDKILNAIDGNEEIEVDRKKRRAEEKEKKAARERRKQKRKEIEERAAIRKKTRVARPTISAKELPSGASSSKSKSGAPTQSHSTEDPNKGTNLSAVMDLYAYELSDDELPESCPTKSENYPCKENHDMDTISIHSDSDDSQLPNISQSTALSNNSDPGSESEGSVSDTLAKLDERKKEILCRMYPKGLAKKLLESNKRAPPPKKARRPAPSEADDDGPLLPGQTRVHQAPRGAAPKEIKGDSESELEKSDPEEYRYPTLGQIWSPVSSHPLRRPKSTSTEADWEVKRETATLRYDSSSESELEVIDDTAIEKITDKKRSSKGMAKANSPRAEVTLIDYMLSSTRVFGHGSHTQAKNESRKRHLSGRKQPKKPKFKHDIITSGVRGNTGRQELLSNFEGYVPDRRNKNKSHTRRTSQASSSFSRRSDDTPVYDIDSYDARDSDAGNVNDTRLRAVDPNDPIKRAKRQRDKERKERIRAQGLCIIKPLNGGKARIVSGSTRRDQFVTLDLEGEGPVFNAAYPQPKIRQWKGPIHRRVQSPNPISPLDTSRVARPPRSSPLPEIMERERSGSPAPNLEAGPEEIPITKDSGVPLLPSGITFNSDTYVRKGWLHELISAMQPTSEPPLLMPLRLDLQAYQIRPDLPLDNVCQLVEKIFRDVFDFATDIPEPGQQRRVDDWFHIIHHVCQGISACLAKLDESSRTQLRDVIGTAVTRLGLRLKSLELSSNAIDLAVFQAHWIAIELSIRSGGKVVYGGSTLASSPLNDSIQLLVDQLLILGLRNTMKAVVNDLEDKSLSEPTVATAAAELWTRLIHILSEYDKEGPKRTHTFWQFILASFKSRAAKCNPDVALYEDLWHSVFSLCALSQFSVIGMTLGRVKLPACWDVVTFLCDGIFEQMDAPPAIQDSYIRYILSRCFILNERWGWKIVDISTLVKSFVDHVFAPRMFANLEEEKPEFPQFLRLPNEDSISTFDPKDPAYVLLLKFIVKASKEEPPKPFSIKKLISLSKPHSDIPSKKVNHPMGEMSMVINRISAAIIGVHLDAITYEPTINEMRTFIKFDQADSQTRYTLVRGLQYWAHFVIHQERKLSIGKLAPWAADMATCLADEWKKNEGDELVRRRLLAKILLRVVYQIIYASPQAPEAGFLAALKPLFFVARDDQEIQTYVRQIIVLIIDRWYKAIPPERPPAPKEVLEEESQDVYADAFSDIDWASHDIPEALALDTTPKLDPAPLKQVLSDTNAGWIAFRCFKDCIASGRLSHALIFLSCWVGCRLLTTQHSTEKELVEITELVTGAFLPDPHPQKRTWDGILRKPNREPQQRTVAAILCAAILERCPMAYTMPAFTSALMRNFFLSITCVDDSGIPIHSQCVASLLSVDHLQHPLLKACNFLPPLYGNSGTYLFTRAQFLEFRSNFFDTVFSNLDALIVRGDPEASTLTAYCQDAFSAMRNNLVRLGGNSEQRVQYANFCAQVVDSLKKATNLAERPGMTFWSRWTPTGVPNS